MSINKIMLVGEAYGEQEEREGRPFVGPSGKLLNQLLSQVGISRAECYTTNVFNIRPQPKNDVEYLCGPKADAIPGYPALKSGKYIRAQYAAELHRLFKEIADERPNVIVALGASAAWALLGTSGIKKIRGAPSLLSGPASAAVGEQIKVLPTYHPAAIMREWSLYSTTVADLEKARRESEFPELRRPSREIWIEPNLDDLARFEADHLFPSDSVSVDIETAGGQITCVGFAPSSDRAIVVPFVDATRLDGNYWRSLDEELRAWEFVRRWCATTLPKDKRREYRDLPYLRGVGQNFLYDMQYLWRVMGIEVVNEDDTMLLHHALYPELEKGLGFLATIYTDELAWKFMRTKHETLKKED